jgi:hypothetical protein
LALAQPTRTSLPGIAKLEATLAVVARIAKDDPVVARLRQDISARLLLGGRAGDARKILAGGLAGTASQEHAAALLRDMKALVLGEGKLSTVAVADASSVDKPGLSSAIRGLGPDGKAHAWKLPVRESPLTDRGPVVAAERLAGKLEDRLEEEVGRVQANRPEEARSLARQIQTHLRSVPRGMKR